jgi:integrase
MRVNLTKTFVEGLLPPDSGRLYLSDGKTPGLQLVVTATGHKSFYSYRKISGRPERVLLGKFPELTVENARKAAAVVNGQIAAGVNPQEKRRKMRGTAAFGELFKRYLEDYAKLRKRSWKGDEWQYKAYLTHWEHRRLYEIRQADVKTTHRTIGKKHGHYAANRMLALVRSLFNYAIKEEGYDKANPTIGVSKFDEFERERFLSAEELPRFFKALDAEPDQLFKDFVLMLLFTGARRSNVQAMAWSDVDIDRSLWRIAAGESKNKEPMIVALPPAATEILSRRKAAADGSPWVFPSFGKTGHIVEPRKQWARVLKKAEITDLRLHDLRRSLGSWQAMTGASLPVIGKSLGHRTSAATAVYSRLTMDPVRESVNKATATMIALGRPAKTEGDGNGET